MRQAHRRNEPRRRRAVGPALVAIALATVGLLAFGGTGLGRDAGVGRSGLANPFPAAALTVPRPSGAAPRPSAPPILETRTGPAAVVRPAVDLPDVAPIVALGAGPGSKAVFLGDSYTSGWDGAGLGARGWPALVGADRGWTVVNLAVPGTGFMNPGWTAQPIGLRVDAAIRQRPDVVVVAGGHNDSRWSAATTSRAAVAALRRLHTALPNAVIVVIGPIWQDGTPPTRCLVLRDALRRDARSIGAIFIDPLGEGWFAGASHRFIRADGIHPTDAGHRFIAGRVLADLLRI